MCIRDRDASAKNGKAATKREAVCSNDEKSSTEGNWNQKQKRNQEQSKAAEQSSSSRAEQQQQSKAAAAAAEQSSSSSSSKAAAAKQSKEETRKETKIKPVSGVVCLGYMSGCMMLQNYFSCC